MCSAPFRRKRKEPSMSESILVQAPQGAAAQMFLLFHGVGSTASSMVPLARQLAAAFPDAAIVSVAGPFESDLGSGRQWFSVRGITEDNRSGRIAEVMPLFAQTVHDWQARLGVAPEATTLIGFSQGAIMSLESTLTGLVLAGRVVSLSGRFAHLPTQAPQPGTLHFIHGETDGVIPFTHALKAAERLAALGAKPTVDVLPFTGHEISGTTVDAMVKRLRNSLQRH
jgi:phospholipase/carboxylesterase